MVQGKHGCSRWGTRRYFGCLLWTWAATSLLSAVGCRTPECANCHSRAGNRTPPHLASPTVGLPGTPTLPPTAPTPTNPPQAQSRSNTSGVSGLQPAAATTAPSRLTATGGASSVNLGNAVGSGGGVTSPLPPPADLSAPSSQARGATNLSPAASSRWTPATAPLSPAPPGLSDPGPLPPPPPGSVSNTPVLPPTPPPASLTPQ